ncbi:hypothetical protein Tsubulata_024962 [Turnera subulata]|uniref:W2 domain-containing protein n=1 Tax=Turnera subulata TaxID=218843 RepID=A0A9Q0FZ63_9ROSI|nr:hypothetical protein Tsubulata_024962 [Turnera subulata]
MDFRNIGDANKGDAFYRYKMPKMVTKVEGKGNGIRTNIVNMVPIAKALDRPASYTVKYFGYELGAQSKFDKKTGTSIVNGEHRTTTLAALLEGFIKKYVQCYLCGNPETEIVITKAQMVTLNCAACGSVSDVDMMDRFTKFIVNHPPEKKKLSKNKKVVNQLVKEGEAVDEEQKKRGKEAAKKKGSSCSGTTSKGTVSKKKSSSDISDGDHSPAHSQTDENEKRVASSSDDDDDVQWQADTSMEAAQRRIQEQLVSKVTVDMVMLSTKEEKPKTEEKSSSTENGTKSTAETQERRLVYEIKQHLEKGSCATQLISVLDSLPGTSQEIMNALFAALFEDVDDKGFAKEVNKKMNYLAAAAATKAGEGSQTVLLYAIEDFCSSSKASSKAVKEAGLVLKALYDNDVLEEEPILEWYKVGVSGGNKVSSLWRNVKPMIEWLQSAECESEEED